MYIVKIDRENGCKTMKELPGILHALLVGKQNTSIFFHFHLISMYVTK